MSSVEAVGNEQYSNALFRSQQLASDTTGTLKRSQEDSGLDSGIPAKRAVMHGMDGSLVQMGAPFMGQLGTDNITEVYPVPEKTVGLVIGRGGAEIQSIQTQSGCRVQMSPDADNSGFRQVTLQGNRISVEKAKQLISDVVARAAQRMQGTMFGGGQEGGHSITVEIPIPSNKCGLIIGKQGETIKMLQEQAGCKMLMIQDSQEVTGMPKPLRLSGDPDKVEIGKRLVSDLLSKDDGSGVMHQPRMGIPDAGATAKGEVVVPRSSVGMIIGKGGETIKRLAQETGTKIQFKPDDNPSSQERCAVIMGTRDQIYKATELITELVNKSNMNQSPQQQEIFYMHVPANKTGLVIGKGGETIKQINQESGAHCELSRDPPPNAQEKVFMIKGTQQQIHHATHIIRIKVGDIPPNTPVPMLHGASNPIHAGNGTYGQPTQFSNQFTNQQPIQSAQWNQYQVGGGVIPNAAPAATDNNVWGQNQFYQQGQPANPVTQAPQYQNPQYQQPQAVPAVSAVPTQPQFTQPQQAAQVQPQVQPAVQATQPTINPATGQPDYSAQWAEYYRSVGLHEQAAMVESQMKQNAATRAAAVTAPAAPQYAAASQYQNPAAGVNNAQPAAQHFSQYQTAATGAFPQTGQFQAPGQQPQQF